jgi:O-methyltransferase
MKKESERICDLAKTYKCENYENNVRTALPWSMMKSLTWFLLRNKETLCGGDIAEVGVWRGSVGIILAEIFKEQNIYLFDTFEGIPYHNEFDNIHMIGDFGIGDLNKFNYSSYKEVKDTLSIYGNVHVYQGIFPSQTSYNIIDKKFSLVHLDVDVHQSYDECLRFFYPRMLDGGLILLDDYAIPSCHGATKAVDDFCREYNLTVNREDKLYYIKKG